MDFRDLTEAGIDRFDTKEKFVAFLQALVHDSKHNPDEWEPADIPAFLEALVSAFENIQGFYEWREQSSSAELSWKAMPQMIMVAKWHE